jgi:two-component system CheB/CheR fusion protein
MVVFAEQDIILDPPFSHIDAISCRNLLIYLNADLQKRLLPLFHYALNPNGFLFLGSSETVSDSTDLFAVVNRRWKLYQRKPAINPYRVLTGAHASPTGGELAAPPARRDAAREEPRSLRALVEQNILSRYVPSAVLINEKGGVLYVHGSTGRYLEPATGEANLNIVRMARSGIRLELNTAVRRAVAQKTEIRYAGLRVREGVQTWTFNLVVGPVTPPPASGLFLVVFEEVSAAVEPVGEDGPLAPVTNKDQRIVALERELRARDEYLQTNVEELTTANEELQSANEELQSTTEEMDTSREELQSVNEELTTVNTELQKKIEELSHANDDMNNLLAGTDIGTVLVDAIGRIQRFTPSVGAIFNLIGPDVGRPLSHISTNLQGEHNLAEDARRVFATLAPREAEVQTVDGRWYFMRVLPYRTQESAIVGVVFTFVNISVQHASQERAQASELAAQAHDLAANIVATVREPVLVLDADLRVVTTNEAFRDRFGVSADETSGRLLYDLGNGQWNIPELRRLLEEILPTRSSVHDYDVTHTFEHIGTRKMRVNARELRRGAGEERLILLAIEDVTAGAE